ncbi:MAG TPA: hypothetical protein VGC04_12050 [Cellulomonas sp.]
MSGGEEAVYRRVLRRETHASRAAAAITVAVVLVVLCAAAGASAVWFLVDATARDRVFAAVSGFDVRARTAPVVAVVGGVVMLLGLWLLLLGVLPGRRARHGRTAGRLAVVTDDGVAADVIADTVAGALAVARDLVHVSVGHRSAVVTITPVSGVAVDEAAARRAASDATSRLGRPLAPRIAVASRGVVA